MFRTVAVLLLLFLSPCLQAQRLLTDTVWYNARWEICEEPISRYYRVGHLLSDDTVWYFSGPVRDYTRGHRLLMEGNYSANGWRDGIFKFYNKDGKLRIYGTFAEGAPKGYWQWFYPSGLEQAMIYFGGHQDAFAFIHYSDSLANEKMLDGTGDFEWEIGISEDAPSWRLQGHYTKGKRSGKWEFTPANKDVAAHPFTEHYNDKGEYVKTTGTYLKSIGASDLELIPNRLVRMESLAWDRFFTSEGDTAVKRVVERYLTEKKTPEFISKASAFDSAMGYVLGKLERYRFYLNFIDRDVQGKIEFRIGQPGYPEDISITAQNTDSSEIAFLYFLMNKFRNVDMPSRDGIDFEGYHTIYFYRLSLVPYLPAEFRAYAHEDLVFSGIPKDVLIRQLETDKKKFKKLIRRAYWNNR